MQGISAILVMIMLVLIVIAIVGTSYTFFSGTVQSVISETEDVTTTTTTNMLAQLRMVSFKNNKMVVRNTGLTNLSNFTVLINGEKAYIEVTPPVIGKDAVGTIEIFDAVDEDDEVMVYSVEGLTTSVSLEGIDPCEDAIVCFNFETTGSSVPDLSGNNNDGTFYARHENLIKYSQDFSNGIWGGYCGLKSNIEQNTPDVLAPDGTQTAAKFSLPATIGCASDIPSRGVLQTASPPISDATYYTASVWLRGASGGESISFGISDYHYAHFTLTNDWVRYNYTGFNTHPGNRGLQFFSTTPNAVYYAWGAQLEKQNESSLYTVATSSAIDDGVIPYAGQFPSPWTSGKNGNGARFNAVDNYIRIGNYITEIAQPTEVTYSALVKLEPFTDSHFIVGWWWTDSTGIYVGSNGIVYFGMYHIDGTHKIMASTNAINWNEWNFIAASYSDAEDRVTFVVNGQKNTVSCPWSPRPSPGTYRIAVGKTSSGWPSLYPRSKGIIDEVRIYDKAIY